MNRTGETALWYWRRTRRLTSVLLLLWFAFNLGAAWYAEALNSLDVGGVPLGFLLLSTISPLLFTAIATIYAILINRWERQARWRDDRTP
ncbi:DUF4212 domain-containing protein [Tepidiphilus margaritifer]|uniref:DUF4212 domain-containing protein n=1 Tax=Tepidiphilus margaritifer TaxID=203471 RepID=UPI00040294B7|nr:sodium/substrate symporter small subunit [Tepidiphilus margaritifer]